MKANNVRTNEIENVIKISIGIGKIFDKPKSDIKEREREREREIQKTGNVDRKSLIRP